MTLRLDQPQSSSQVYKPNQVRSTHEILEPEKIFSIVEEEFKNLSPTDIEGGPTIVAQRSLDRALPKQSGINIQAGRNLVANAVKFALEIPRFAFLFISEIDQKRVESLEKQGMTLQSSSLSEELSPAIEKLEKLKGDVDSSLGNTSAPEDYRKLSDLLGPLKTVYSSSQPAPPLESQPATKGELSDVIGRLEIAESSCSFATQDLNEQVKSEVETQMKGFEEAIKQQDNDKIDKFLQEYENDHKEKQKQLAKLEEQAKKEANWRFAAQVADGVGQTFDAFDSFLCTKEYRKEISKENVRSVRRMATSFRSAIDQTSSAPDESPIQIGLEFFRHEVENNEESLKKIRGLLCELKKRSEKAQAQGQELQAFGNRLGESQVSLSDLYKEMEKERNKIRSSYEKIGLGANLISTVTSFIPGVGPFISAGVQTLNKGAQLVGNRQDKPFRKGEGRLEREMEKRQDIGGRFFGLSSHIQTTVQGYSFETDQLEMAEISILRVDPTKHREHIDRLFRDHNKDVERAEKLRRDIAQKEQEDKQKGFQSHQDASTTHHTTIPHQPVSLTEIGLKDLYEKDTELAKKHATGKSVHNIWWDTSRGVVVVEKSGKFRAYKIGNGKSPAIWENESKGTLIQHLNTLPIVGEATGPSRTSKDIFSGTSMTPLGIVSDMVGKKVKVDKKGVAQNVDQQKQVTKDLSQEFDSQESGIRLEDLKNELTNLVGNENIPGSIADKKEAIFEAVKNFSEYKLDCTKEYARVAKELAAQGHVVQATDAARNTQKSAIKAQEHAIKLQLQQFRRLEEAVAIGEINIQSQSSPEAVQALEEARSKMAAAGNAINVGYQELSGLDSEKFPPKSDPMEVFKEIGSEFIHHSDEHLALVVKGATENAETAVKIYKGSYTVVHSAQIKEAQLNPLIELSKCRRNRLGLLGSVIRPSEDPVFKKAEEFLEDNKAKNDVFLSALQNTINHSIELVKHADMMLGYKEGEGLSGKIPERAPETIMKTAELTACIDQCHLAVKVFLSIVKGEEAGSAVGDILKTTDKTNDKEDPKTDDTGIGKTGKQITGTLEVIKKFSDDKKIKTFLSIAIPASHGLILCHELYLISQGKGAVEDPQLKAIKDLHEDMNKGFDDLKKDIEKFKCFVEKGFHLLHEHMSLVHDSLSLQLATAEESGRIRYLFGRVDDRFADIKRYPITWRMENPSVPVYAGYIGDDRYLSGAYETELERRSDLLRDLLTTFKTTILPDMSSSTQNGVWIKDQTPDRGETRIETADQFLVVREHPVQTTGLLAFYLLKKEGVPDFYQYEHYVHIFIQLAAKLLQDSIGTNRGEIAQIYRARDRTPTVALKKLFRELSEISVKFMPQAEVLDMLLSQKTLDRALTEYKEKQLALIDALKGVRKGNNYQELLIGYERTGETKVIGIKSDIFSFLEGFKPGFYSHSPVSKIKVSDIVNPHLYRSVHTAMRQGWCPGYLENIRPAMNPECGIDGILQSERVCALRKLSEDLEEENFVKKTLLSIWEDKQFQRITPADRKEISGNFIELAYRVDSKTQQMLRQINFCRFETREEMACRVKKLNPEFISLARNAPRSASRTQQSQEEIELDAQRAPVQTIQRPSPSYGLVESCHLEEEEDILDEPTQVLRLVDKIDTVVSRIHMHAAFHIDEEPPKTDPIQRNTKLTEELNSHNFEELFAFSVVLAAKEQTANGLTGRTFVVLSDQFNQEGLKILQRQEQVDADTVEFENRFYKKVNTSPDGACALHALLGQKVGDNDPYKLDGARGKLVAAMTTGLLETEEPKLRTRLLQMGIRANLPLKDFLANGEIRRRGEVLRGVENWIQSEVNDLLKAPIPTQEKSFVQEGKAQSIEEIEVLARCFIEQVIEESSIEADGFVEDSFYHIKSKLESGKLGCQIEKGLLKDFYDSPWVTKTELKEAIKTIHHELHKELESKGLRLNIPYDRAERINWEQYDDRVFGKTSFQAKVSEVLSMLVAIKWIHENRDLMNAFNAFNISRGMARIQDRKGDYRHLTPKKEQGLLNRILRDHLNCARERSDPSSQMLFSDVDNDTLKRICSQEADVLLKLYRENEAFREKVEILAQEALAFDMTGVIPDDVIDVRVSGVNKSISLVEIFKQDPNGFLGLMEEKDLKAFSRIQNEKARVQEYLRNFGSSKTLFNGWTKLKDAEDSLTKQEKEAWLAQWTSNEAFREKVFILAPQQADDTFKKKASISSQETLIPMTREEIAAAISEKPARLMSVIKMDNVGFLEALLSEHRQAISSIQTALVKNRKDQENFVERKEVFERYISVILHEPRPGEMSFWFNTSELEFIAYLFKKKAQVIQKAGVGEQKIVTEHFNKDLPGETVVIHYNGFDHFSRCEPLEKDTGAYVEGLLKSGVIEDSGGEKRKQLLKDYQEFLDVTFQKKEAFVRDLDPEGKEYTVAKNPFDPGPEQEADHTQERKDLKYTDFGTAILLSPKDEKLCPLAFPPALLKYIETDIAPSGITMSKVPITRTYSFELNASTGIYELAIEYKLEKHDYLKFVVAQFGDAVVDAFRSQLVPESEDTSFESAFLVQMIYGDGLPVPGDGSFRIISTGRNTVVPVPCKEKFTGVYNLLANLPKNTQIIDRVDHALPRSEEQSLIPFEMKTSHKDIRKIALPNYEAAEEVYQSRLRAAIKAFKYGKAYKEAQEAFLKVETLLKLTIGGKREVIRSPDSFMEIASCEALDIHRDSCLQAKVDSVSLGSLLNKSTERVLIKKRLEELKAIHAFAEHLSRSSNPVDIVKIPAVIQQICANKEPFSYYQR